MKNTPYSSAPIIVRVHRAFATSCLALALAACGGGGSGDAPTPSTVGGIAVPFIEKSPQAASMIVGQTALFQVEASGTGVSFAWESQGLAGFWLTSVEQIVSGANASELRVPNLTMDHHSTLYRAVARNSAGHAVSSEAILTMAWGSVETLEPNSFDFGSGSEGFGSADGGSPSGGDGEGAGAGGGLGKTVGVRMTVARTADAAPLGSALTGATSGLVRIKAGPGTAPVLITMSGTGASTYYDEGKGAMLAIGPDQQLHALVLAFDQHLGVTTLTEAAYRYALNQFIVDPAQVREGTVALKRTATPEEVARLTPTQIQRAYDAILAEVARMLPARYRLASIATLPTPVDGASGRGAITNNRYGIMQAVVGGLALAAGRFNPSLSAPALTMNAQLADDLTDGVIDGLALDQRSVFGPPGAAYGPLTLSQAWTEAADAQMEQFGDGSSVAPPVITTQPITTTIAEGGTTTLIVRASGTALSYQWFNGDVAIAGATMPSYTTAVAGVYRVQIRNSVGLVTSESATVNVTPTIVAPIITVQPVSATISEGSTHTFTVVATGTNVTYQWFNGDAAIGGATAPSYTTAVAGVYRVQVSNSGGSVTTASATLSVAPTIVAPTITVQPASASVRQGDTHTFTVGATGTSITYQWFNAAGPLPNASSSSYSTGAAETYFVIVRNSVGFATSSSAVLTVIPIVIAPTITRQPVSASIVAGRTVTLLVEATGTSPLAYQWFNSRGLIAAATGSSFTTGTAETYHVVVTNTADSAISAQATVTVISAPVITREPMSATVVSGQSATFNVVATGQALRYQWNTVTILAGRPTQINPIPNATSSSYTTGTPGTYNVIVRNEAGPVTSDDATLTVLTSPVIESHPKSMTIYQGATGTFGVKATGLRLSYQWQVWQVVLFRGNWINIERATSDSYTTGNAGIYRVLVSNPAGSTSSNSAVLTVYELH